MKTDAYQDSKLVESLSIVSVFQEGDLVRSTSDLYRSYGVGYIQKIRGEQAKVEFNPSVFMQPPYRSQNRFST